MKGFYFGASFFFTIIILIIAFENINSTITKSAFFFASMDGTNIFFIVIGIALIGFIAGFFATLYVLKPGKKEIPEDTM
ncbi:MAG: hypothetical protein NTZ25_03180 [Candidatus Peregrinibacteria bacterium]|nr:hypothetical protein [Candidatus Peregrinibacteria bacterium]